MDARRADLLADLLTGRLELHDDHPDPENSDDHDDHDDHDDGDTDPTEAAADEPAENEADSPVPLGAPEYSADDGSDSDDAYVCGTGRAHPACSQQPSRHRTNRHRTERVPHRPARHRPARTPTDPARRHRARRPARHREPEPDPGHPRSGHQSLSHARRPSSPGRKRNKKRCTWKPLVRRPAPAGKPLVHVIIPYSTLTGADDHPGELAGYGPIPADLAREIAADAVWKRLLIDPESGTVLDHGRSTYRPPTALAEFVRARDGPAGSPICTPTGDQLRTRPHHRVVEGRHHQRTEPDERLYPPPPPQAPTRLESPNDQQRRR